MLDMCRSLLGVASAQGSEEGEPPRKRVIPIMPGIYVIPFPRVNPDRVRFARDTPWGRLYQDYLRRNCRMWISGGGRATCQVSEVRDDHQGLVCNLCEPSAWCPGPRVSTSTFGTLEITRVYKQNHGTMETLQEDQLPRFVTNIGTQPSTSTLDE